MLKNAPSMYVVVVFSLLAIVSLSLFGVLQITAEHNPRLGYLELLGAAAATLNLGGLWLTRNVRLARTLLLLTVISFLTIMLITGGTQGTGIFWFFVFPVSAFFLAGGRGGAYWLAGLIAITVLLAILSELDLVEIPYTLVTIRQLLLCLTVVGVGIYTYQLAREKYEKQRAAEQQELDHAKNEFLTLASHQLRTPISAISWFSEMLLHGDAGKLTKAQREHIQQVYASNQRSASIVDAIIMVSNLQSGTLGARPEPVDLQKLCHETLEEQMDAQTVARRLKIKEIYDPELKHIQWDPGLIKTIIRNLVSNAIKYTPDEGEITISIGLRDSAKQHDSQQHMLYIEVSDTGYGIPKNEQHKIFAKLFRASNIKTKDTDGTGLGLYIVKAILAQAGGQISFKSTENKGSTFTVLLPSSGASQDMSSKVGA